MKSILGIFFGLAVLLFPIVSSADSDTRALAEEQNYTKQDFYSGKIIEIVEDQERNIAGTQTRVQVLKVGVDNHEIGEVIVENTGTLTGETPYFEPGDQVLLTRIETPFETSFHIVDRYRVPQLLMVLVVFFLLVLHFIRFKGLSAFLGLLISIAILIWFIVPRILSGSNPILIGFVGAFFIAVLSLYMAHGVNKRSSIALLSTLATLLVSAFMAWGTVVLTGLTGLGSEEAFFLQLEPDLAINLQGLLLAGIVIGALGVLDDITTAQTAVVEQLHAVNKELDSKELYTRAFHVGREHIISLVNTLALAYAGASLPLFVFFSLEGQPPLWVSLNNPAVSEEIVRTLVGSASLVLAVPITTYFAVKFYKK